MLLSTNKVILKIDTVPALAYLPKFGKLGRNIPESSHMVTAILAEEKTPLTSYLELGCLRFDTSFEHTLEIDKNLEVENIEVPLMLMKSLTSSMLTENQLARE
ncbi:hypothetical protein [[Muricauda] lutisoli]|uniref:Uncharacterized protein n=1 Tax=[Muricauda] lutisoli TaxID=2816035 RepID=A0ABS3EYB4_9FLAO|nr:hypothetical protein [[Muricauda] lutisoli]MBO0331249.1 hypothetical protein [[Muricauda] lutisoli]